MLTTVASQFDERNARLISFWDYQHTANIMLVIKDLKQLPDQTPLWELQCFCHLGCVQAAAQRQLLAHDKLYERSLITHPPVLALQKPVAICFACMTHDCGISEH